MVCKGICNGYKSGKPLGVNSRYELGQKRCSICEKRNTYKTSTDDDTAGKKNMRKHVFIL